MLCLLPEKPTEVDPGRVPIVIGNNITLAQDGEDGHVPHVVNPTAGEDVDPRRKAGRGCVLATTTACVLGQVK